MIPIYSLSKVVSDCIASCSVGFENVHVVGFLDDLIGDNSSGLGLGTGLELAVVLVVLVLLASPLVLVSVGVYVASRFSFFGSNPNSFPNKSSLERAW